MVFQILKNLVENEREKHSVRKQANNNNKKKQNPPSVQNKSH